MHLDNPRSTSAGCVLKTLARVWSADSIANRACDPVQEAQDIIAESSNQTENRMRDKHEAHLKSIIESFTAGLSDKYRDGQQRHGGNVWERDCLNDAMDEVYDLAVYLSCVRYQRSLAIGYLESGKVEEALNVLRFGNPEGPSKSSKQEGGAQ